MHMIFVAPDAYGGHGLFAALTLPAHTLIGECVGMRTHARACVCMHVRACAVHVRACAVHVHACSCTQVHPCLCMHVHTCVHAHMRTCAHAHMRTCAHACVVQVRRHPAARRLPQRDWWQLRRGRMRGRRVRHAVPRLGRWPPCNGQGRWQPGAFRQPCAGRQPRQ